jgi:MoxR-like ATPase
VKNTTNDIKPKVDSILTKEKILEYQSLVRRVPVPDNVVEYAVKLVHKTRLNNPLTHLYTEKYLEWGAGPRASQNLILAAKCECLLKGKYTPDIEDVKAVALPILRHRIVRNFKAEAEGITNDQIIQQML